MKALITLIIAALVTGVAVVGYIYLAALGCGMNTTGCSSFSIGDDDMRLIALLVAFALLGVVALIWWLRRCRSGR